MYHTLSWYDAKKNKLKNKKSDVNFSGLYKDEMETLPQKKSLLDFCIVSHEKVNGINKYAV